MQMAPFFNHSADFVGVHNKIQSPDPVTYYLLWARLYPAGDSPVSRLKIRWKYLGDSKPVSQAISVMFLSELISISCAYCTRSLLM